jgi:hypothetical protein
LTGFPVDDGDPIVSGGHGHEARVPTSLNVEVSNGRAGWDGRAGGAIVDIDKGEITQIIACNHGLVIRGNDRVRHRASTVLTEELFSICNLPGADHPICTGADKSVPVSAHRDRVDPAGMVSLHDRDGEQADVLAQDFLCRLRGIRLPGIDGQQGTGEQFPRFDLVDLRQRRAPLRRGEFPAFLCSFPCLFGGDALSSGFLCVSVGLYSIGIRFRSLCLCDDPVRLGCGSVFLGLVPLEVGFVPLNVGKNEEGRHDQKGQQSHGVKDESASFVTIAMQDIGPLQLRGAGILTIRNHYDLMDAPQITATQQ